MPFAPDLVLHSTTRLRCDALLSNPPHAVLLHGQKGVGLTTLANELAKELNSAPGSTATVAPIDGKDISIDQIRELYRTTRTVHDTQQCVIVDQADMMSHPAQNAFLKLLEEPPRRVTFILTAHQPQQLLATIMSRVTVVEVLRITAVQTSTMLHADDVTKKSQLMFLGQGRPAELMRLMNDDDYFTRQSSLARSARTLLQGTLYERLILVKEYAQDRETMLELLMMAGELLRYSSKKGLPKATADKLAAISRAAENIATNANIRLQMITLSLSL